MNEDTKEKNETKRRGRKPKPTFTAEDIKNIVLDDTFINEECLKKWVKVGRISIDSAIEMYVLYKIRMFAQMDKPLPFFEQAERIGTKFGADKYYTSRVIKNSCIIERNGHVGEGKRTYNVIGIEDMAAFLKESEQHKKATPKVEPKVEPKATPKVEPKSTKSEVFMRIGDNPLEITFDKDDSFENRYNKLERVLDNNVKLFLEKKQVELKNGHDINLNREKLLAETAKKKAAVGIIFFKNFINNSEFITIDVFAKLCKNIKINGGKLKHDVIELRTIFNELKHSEDNTKYLSQYRNYLKNKLGAEWMEPKPDDPIYYMLGINKQVVKQVGEQYEKECN